MRVDGEVIGTTGEYPYYVVWKGWVKAAFLEMGDILLSHDGQQRAIQGLSEADSVATVYNLRVADYHTYFVGCQEWGFSVWAHNVDCFSQTVVAATNEVLGGTRYFENRPGLAAEVAYRMGLGTPQGRAEAVRLLQGSSGVGATATQAEAIVANIEQRMIHLPKSAVAGLQSRTTAVLMPDGYYESNGYRYSRVYYERLWNEGREAPGLRTESILAGATSRTPDPQGRPGFYRYEYDGWELI